ncbi:unnamed protein product [Cylindrotheca closterium]|uniref:Glycosyltransferase subfamily 4-like N-terminal domain-containing protein n=1 Tax=Cylindrotheca closterium TaxID=2856 RepID=A0AAD2CHY6_9STRA|nr:unnamed protein product [Cylindrotheca closterium]
MHAIVVVLGDVGRSPRMQYHAASLLENGHSVSLIGYEGEKLISALIGKNERLQVFRFSVPAPKSLRKILPLYLFVRASLLFFFVFRALFQAARNRTVDVVLVQNPPAMPLLFVTHLYCLIRGIVSGHRPAFVIDWHNLGYSMLDNKLFSAIARVYEKFMAPYATAHLCVTAAMKLFLQTHFDVPHEKISVLHDCPPNMFQPLSIEDQHELLSRLHKVLCSACPKHWHENLNPTEQTLLTEISDTGGYEFRKNRPCFLVSATSWTPDEDFGELLDALVRLDRRIRLQKSSLKVLMVVTGKGPQKEHYLERISQLKLESIAIQTLWLEPADYPRLLACADLGVSLHTSTSGLDLPMKVLDLFGCAVPVCARNFSCLSELVKDGTNGKVFDSSSELEEQLWGLLEKLDGSQRRSPHSYGDLAEYSQALQNQTRWNENWGKHALPVLRGNSRDFQGDVK